MEQGGGVIVVDDEGLIAYYITTILEGGGVRVVGVAATAAQALQIAAATQPALAVVDIGLPDIDGIELARRLREERDIGIIFSTGFGDTETRQRIQTIESSRFVQKPLHPDELTALVLEVLRRTEFP
jgi:DNA-binding response OmpR family regulator